MLYLSIKNVMRLPAFFITLLLCLPFLPCAQNHRTDSLKQILKSAKNDTSTVGLLNVLVYQLYLSDQSNKDNTLLLIDSAIRVAERTNYFSGNIKARFIAGNIYKNYGQTARSKEYLLGALPLCEQTKNAADHFKINHTLGLCFDEEGNSKQASEYFFAALRYAEQSNNPTQLSNAYGGLGNLYATQGDYIKAISYQQKALKYRAQLNDKMRMSFSYVNLGNAYKNLARFDSAQYYYNKALIIQTSEKNTVGQAYSYTGIGNVYLKKGLPEASIDYFKRAYALLSVSDDAEVRAWLLNMMGENYRQLNDLNTALKFLNEAVEFTIKSNRLSDLKESYLILAKTYKAKKDFEKAYGYFEKYSELKDTLLNADVDKKISSLEYNYQIEQDKKIAELENEKIRIQHEEEVSRQRLIIWVAIIIVILVSLFSVFIFWQYKAKKAANFIIRQQKLVTEQQKAMLEEKQKEITDSIRYAKRIQQTLMPSEKYIHKNITHLKN